MSKYSYITQIQRMMKLAKEGNKAEMLTINGETLLIKYEEKTNDYILHYSWFFDNRSMPLNSKVVRTLNEYNSGPKKYTERYFQITMDIVQVGLFTGHGNSAMQLSGYIDYAKTYYFLIEIRDTSYIFCGNKLLRIIQYLNPVNNPLDCLDIISKWHRPTCQNTLQDKKLVTFLEGVEYYHENNDVIFSIGNDKKTIFHQSVKSNKPIFLYIDSDQRVKHC